jgi:sugar/nucleoside kinase (ribokinase family)
MTQSPDPVLIVGTVAYDGIETPKATRDPILGGSGSYAAVASSYFAPTRLSGMVGTDFAAADTQRFLDKGIDLEGLERHPTEKCFYWRGRYHENFNIRDTVQTDLNCLAYFEANLPASYADSKFVMLGNISPELQHKSLDQLKAPTFVLADTIVFWLETQRERFLELLPRINLLVINDSESEILTGEKNIFKAGPLLQKMGVPGVLIKKGEHGAVLFHADGIFALPAYPVTQVEDPTGAGDSFAGALLGSLATQGEASFAALKRALPYATAVASLTVEAFSLDQLEAGGMPEVERRVALLREMTRWE